MDEKDFEGTLVLEKLAEIDKVDDFFDAIDSDDFDRCEISYEKSQSRFRNHRHGS